MELIPASVLTGFLGSGKSTLLQRVLTDAHGKKIAVIENEFGEENIDGEIIGGNIAGGGERIIQMSNGCVCCTIRDDLRATLLDLAERRRAGDLDFTRVMIETTGLADPGPVAQTFFLDEAIASLYRLDAILTLVDAKHAMWQLDARREARRQVGFADHLFISKADLVTTEDLAILSERLHRMNPRAPRTTVHFGEVGVSKVFDLGGFNLDPNLELSPDPEPGCDAREHSANHHRHDDDVKSFVFRSERAFHPRRFGQFMNALVGSHGQKLLRYKGILNLHGEDRKVILQGLHQLMSHDVGAPWDAGEARVSKLVFIGIELPKALLLRSLEQCLWPPQ
jgi:G3E family GTPase